MEFSHRQCPKLLKISCVLCSSILKKLGRRISQPTVKTFWATRIPSTRCVNSLEKMIICHASSYSSQRRNSTSRIRCGSLYVKNFNGNGSRRFSSQLLGGKAAATEFISTVSPLWTSGPNVIVWSRRLFSLNSRHIHSQVAFIQCWWCVSFVIAPRQWQHHSMSILLFVILSRN